jgi:hypothetical protein
MSQPFENVREQLLRAGIAPRHVRRYVTELGEHLADLSARERDAGHDAKAAAERARTVLGADGQLVQAMLDRAPHSLTVRAPWAVFALLPVLTLVAALAAIDESMMRLLGPVRATWHGVVPDSYGSLIAAMSFTTDYLLGPVIAIGCIALALRQRLSSRWVWIGLGLIALLSGMFGFYMNIVPPQNWFPGGPVFSALPIVWGNGRVNSAATLAVMALRAGILFAIAGLAYRAMRSRLPATAA